ncbi:hypothetical protein KFK09_026487 [Dendrobium nobile]|uniref:DUF4283 domain-containing protein n=1 Tax=Dendrobium nobile TaxID=94219 RepID=A0A8T3A7X5_DENNO|nr:hypothetical protein KFK09_026487 [Dendrobium nobile]
MVVPDRRQRIAGGNLSSDLPRNGPFKSSDQNLSKICIDPNEQVSVRKSSNLVINEGFRPPLRLDPLVEGKGKGVLEDQNDGVKDNVKKPDSIGNLIIDSTSSSNVVLKVNKFTGMQDSDVLDRVNKNLSVSFEKEDEIAVSMSEDGMAMKLNLEKELANALILKKSLVIKVLGQNIPFSIYSQELRRQLSKFGSFHLTTLVNSWILCSFTNIESMEEVLSGGPWYIWNHIIGMDRWTSSFSMESLKGITSPVWIGFSDLPLSYWDEENIPKIASMIGVPMLLDGNSFKWGNREYARYCVRIDLERKLPKGVWIEGLHWRSFQKVEYEKLTSLCYQCGRVGRNKVICPEFNNVPVKETCE